MCGILALFRKKESCTLDCPVLNGRGPDSVNIVQDGNGRYLLAFYRLAINGTSSEGNQPMEKDGIFLMCNGEIYNYKELAEEYKIPLVTGSDCEIIIPLYQQLGFREMLQKLHGVFAIVMVIPKENKVLISRDRIGVRPLFYGTSNNGEFGLASVPNALTPMFPTIFPITPSSYMTFTIDSSTEFRPTLVSRFSRLAIPSVLQPVDLTTLGELLVKAVKMRLLSDRPIACLLSGGLDSSIITAIIVKFLGGENVRTYSIGMEGSTDLEYARVVADYLHTNHTEVLFTPEQGFEIIPKVIEALGSYDITTVRASVGMYLISKYISENTQDKVIFSGEGSDELLGGYLYFHKAPDIETANLETLRLLEELHLYDVLRCDRCISVHGLEPRVPFLDKDVVDYVLSLDPKDKFGPIVSTQNASKGIEKEILRKAFSGFLPESVLWRRKEGFSDGVSSVKKAWYQYIQEFIEKIPDLEHTDNYPSKEAMYYKLIFDKCFPKYDLKLDYWMPRWSNTADPSGRLIEID